MATDVRSASETSQSQSSSRGNARIKEHPWLDMGYAVALVVVGVAWFVRWLLNPWIDDGQHLLLTFSALLPLAVAVRAGPFLAAAIVSFAGTWLLLLPYERRLVLAEPSGVVAIAIVGVAVAATSLTVRLSRRLHERAWKDVERERARLQLVTDAAPALIAYIDGAQRYQFVNRTYEVWFGKPRSEFLGRTMREVLGPEAIEQVEPYVKRALRGERVRFEAEVRYRTGNRWVEGNYVPDRDATGLVSGIFGLVFDITERKRVEEALKEETFVAETLNRIGRILTADLDLRRIVQSVTDEATALAGAQCGAFFYNFLDEQGGSRMSYTLSGMDHRACAQFAMPKYMELFASTFLGSGLVRSDDVTSDPRYVGMLPSDVPIKSYLAAPVTFRSGDLLGGLWFGHVDKGVFTDRHERIVKGIAAQAAIAIDNARLYAQLQDSNERFRQLAEHVNDVFWIADAPDLKIRYLSPAYERIWGRSRESLYVRPMSFLDAIHVDDRDRVCRNMERQIRGEDMADEYRIVRPDGEVRWIWDRTYAIRDESGEVVRLAGIMEDITERKVAVERLQEADRRKDTFLAILAHELRNPLAPVRTAVGILKNSRAPPGKSAQMIATIERQVEVLVHLIDDLLDVSRIKGGKVTLRRQRLDLRRILAEVAEVTGPLCESRGLNFSMHLPSDPLGVEVDAVRMAQVVGNLVNNACKYTDRGGRVVLLAETREREAIVRVQDTGIGMAPEQLPRIFEMFAQEEEARARAPAGLGIGLFLARALVEMHGGSLEARSEGIGKGSEFIIRMPNVAQRSAEEAAATATDALMAGTVVPRRVLVVDDNEDARSTLELLLQLHGHEVQTAADGQQAIRAAEAFRPSTILLDIGLPVMDGYEVARRLRHQPWGKDMRLVAMTGWGQERDRERAKEAGFDLHVTKPVHPDRLESLLRGAEDPGPRRASSRPRRQPSTP